MNVLPLRQGGRIDFEHRANEHDLPMRMGVGHGGDQVRIETLVDDAIIAQARVPDSVMQRMNIVPVQRLLEVHHVDAAGKTVGVWMTFAFRIVQARAAGKHQIGPAQQRRFTLQ